MFLRRSYSARNPKWLTLVVLLACAIASQADSLFIAGEVPNATGTLFSSTNNGITATFSSPADPNGFVTDLGPPALFNTWGPEYLLDGPGNTNIPLDIGFSSLLTSITLNFAVEKNTATPFILQAFLGGTLVGTQDGQAGESLDPTDNLMEGVLSFNGAVFDNVVLSTDLTVPAFAIGNVDVVVDPIGVPEPSTLFSTVAGAAVLGGVALLRRRRNGLTLGRG